MKIKLLALTLLWCLPLLAEPGYLTFPSDIEWKQKDSEHFHTIFRQGLERFADQTLDYAEKAHGILDSIFPEGPEKTWIVIADHADSLNGYALTFPFPHMVIYAFAPTSSSQLSPLDNWHYSVVLHEYVHIRHIYPTGGLWKLLHGVFGSVIAPNGMMPSHLHEGIATFIESNFTERGRGKGTPFKMYLRKAVEADVWGKEFAPLDLYDGSYSRWPHGASAYFFGYLTYEELWKRKGKEGIRELTDAYSRNLPYFINRPLENVFGIDYEKLWQDIYARTSTSAKKEISDLKSNGISPLTYWTDSRFSKKELLLSPDGTKLGFRSQTPDTVTEWNIYDAKSGKLESKHIVPPTDGDGSCWLADPKEDLILYIGSWSEKRYDLSVIQAHSANTGDTISLPESIRDRKHIHSIACDSKSRQLWVVDSLPGKQTITKYAWKESILKDLKEAGSWELTGSAWFSALAPGETGYFFTQESTDSVLWKWNEKEPQRLAAFTGITSRAKQLANGQLEIVANADSIDNVWLLDPQNRKMKQVTAVVGGIAETVSASDSRWILSYEHKGYDLAKVAAFNGSTRELQSAKSRRPESVATSAHADVEYSPWSTLAPKTWIPSVLFVPNGVQFGAWIPGFDISQRHHYDIYGGYDSRGLPFGLVSYGYRFGGLYRATASVNYSPNYLVSTESFFKVWGGELGFEASIPGSGLSAKVGPVFKRVESSQIGPANQSVGVETTLQYRKGLKVAPNGISPGNGLRVFGTHQQILRTLGSDDNYFASTVGIDGYLDFPLLRNSVFYLGSRLGYTEGTALYNSYYQAGGELLFSQGKGTFLNRGYTNGYFAASRVFNLNLEYRFPLQNVERGHAFFPAFLNRIHAALVFDATSLDRGIWRSHQDLMKVFYVSAGVELKTDWKLFYYLPSQLRIGAYHGFSPGGENLYLTTAIEASL